MPLGFKTLSHGEIPIGFFNIESDMFLINNYFIFASDICEAITEWTKGAEEQALELQLFIIEDPEDIGNLMGAINGLVFTGFIGELYKRYPFPEKSEDFMQNTQGYKTQKEVEDIIRNFGKLKKINVLISKKEGTIDIGEYKFSKEQFHEVLAYIWRGGMPLWRDDRRPDYVEVMMKAVMKSENWLFKA
jgi:hypothetical protein